MESYRKGIVWSSFFNVVVQVLGFVTSIVFACYFGAQAKTDVYYYCLSVLSLLAGFLNALDSSVLIPEAMHLAEQKGREESVRFLNFFLYLFLGFSALLTIAMAFRPASFLVIFSRFDPTLLRTNSLIVAWSIPFFGLQVVSQYLSDILAAHKHFSLPVVLGIVNRVIVLTILVAFHRSLDVLSVLVGTTAAFSLQIAVAVWMLRTRLHWDFRTRWIAVERRIRNNIVFSQAGSLASMLAAYVPMFLLSAFPAGIVTALNYGLRIASIPALMITAQVSSVIGIKFNELCARQDWNGVDQAFLRGARILLFLLLPMTAFLFVFAHEIMVLLLQRGAFGAEAVDKSALFFRWFVLMLPGVAMNTLFARLFMGTRKLALGAWFQIVANALLVGLTVIGMKILGAVGYPVAWALFNVLEIVGLWWVFHCFFPFIHYGAVLQDLLKMAAVSSVLAIVVWYLRSVLIPFGNLIVLAIGAVIFGGLFLGTNWLFPLSREINHECLDFIRNRGFDRRGS